MLSRDRVSRKQFSKFEYQKLEDRQMLSANVPDLDSHLELTRDHLQGSPETAYLIDGASDVRFVEVKYGLASTTTRYQQVVNGLPVHNAFITINQDRDGNFEVVHHELAHDPSVVSFPKPTQVDVTLATAELLAMRHAGIDKLDLPTEAELGYFVNETGEAVQAWDMYVYNLTDNVGDYMTVVDSTSGSVLIQENRVSFFTNGSGLTYEPNPYQAQGNGTGMNDNDDATSPILDAQRVNVVLQGLDEGTGLLTGEFVDLATLNSSVIDDVDADEPTRVYEYDRDDPRFEQVVIYSAVDQINRYFHELGFDDDTGTPNGIRDFPTLANAHWFEDDQSFYSGGNDAIHFGDGGVDDGEDVDIVAHEYGHAIQFNQNAFWGGGEMGAMGEGFGDYLAAVFYKDHGDPAFQELHAAAVGEWDATSYSSDDPPNLRRVDGNKMYPFDLVGQVHADGEIWSRALWDLQKNVGEDYANQLVLESHFMLPASASMVDGANFILMANQNINGGENFAATRHGFAARGILPAQAIVEFDLEMYSAGDEIQIVLSDVTNMGSTIDVVVSTGNGDMETVTLTDVHGTGLMRGSISSTQSGVSVNDGTINVASPMTDLTVRYTQGFNVVFDTATIDSEIVTGTDGDDIIYVNVDDIVTININGVETRFDTSVVDSFLFDARGGNDQIIINDSPGNDVIRMEANQVWLDGLFDFYADNVEDVRSVSGGGFDSALLFGSDRDDVFRMFEGGSQLSGEGYQREVRGYSEIRAFGGLGTDRAFLSDTAGNDRVYANSTFTNVRNDNGFVNVRDFERVSVFADNGGTDFVSFIGSDGSDNLDARANQTTFTTNGVTLIATAFERTWADGAAGNDTATLTGTPGNDILHATPYNTYLYQSGSYFNQALRFENITANGLGGSNRAIFRDSPGNDTLYATPTFASIVSDIHAVRANGFSRLSAFGSAGLDKATLADSTGNDRFVARPNNAFLVGDGFLNFVQNFNEVTTESRQGRDVAIFHGSRSDNRFFGKRGVSYMTGNTFRNTALNFRNVTAFLNQGGFDIGVLTDDRFNDTFIGRDGRATLFGEDYMIVTHGLSRVHANAINGGMDTLSANQIDFELRIGGDWS